VTQPTKLAAMANESGKVNLFREALIEVKFPGSAAIECVVDTGFDGGLMLPRTLIPSMRCGTNSPSVRNRNFIIRHLTFLICHLLGKDSVEVSDKAYFSGKGYEPTEWWKNSTSFS
jgi:hypothetical protein